MKNDFKKQLEDLVDKAAETKSASEALQFAQAAQQLACVINILADAESS